MTKYTIDWEKVSGSCDWPALSLDDITGIDGDEGDSNEPEDSPPEPEERREMAASYV